MRSYLVGTRQYVRYNGSTSSVTVMQCGVPQDSVLGPLYISFFTLHICVSNCWRAEVNRPCWIWDMQMICRSMITALPVTRAPAHQSTHSLHRDRGGRWMSSNCLRLNPSKTEFIWLGSTRRLARCTFDPITIVGEIIQPSQTVRDLGAYIDSSIGFAEHVTRLVRTCYFHIRSIHHRVLARLGEGVGPDTPRLL